MRNRTWDPARVVIALGISLVACGGSGPRPDGGDGPAEHRPEVHEDGAPDALVGQDGGSAGADALPDGNSSHADGAAGTNADAGAGADAARDLAAELGADRGLDATADALRVTCPPVPPLTAIEPPAAPSGTTAIDMNKAGLVLLYSFGWLETGSVLFDTNGLRPTTAVGALAPAVPALQQVLASGPDTAVLGLSAMTRALLCRGPCVELGTLSTAASDISRPTDISDTSIVVGAATLDAMARKQPFRWTASGGMVALGTLGGTIGEANAVNAAGTVVGRSELANGNSHAFMFDTAIHDLGTLGGSFSAAQAINAAGDIVGGADTAGGKGHAFLWHAGTMQDLGTLGGDTSAAHAINASGQVVGTSTTSSGQTHLFFWSAGKMQDLGTLGGSIIKLADRHALNDAGQVVGTARNAAGRDHAFVWQLGQLRDLGTLGGVTSAAVAINAAGRIAGNSLTAATLQRAFFVDPGLCTVSAEP